MAEKKKKEEEEKKESPDEKLKEDAKKETQKEDAEGKVKTEEKAGEKPAQEAAPVPKAPPRKRRVAVLHVFSSKNDTIITATDLSGAETLAWSSGGSVVKAHREEGRPYAAMQAAIRVVSALKEKGIYFVHVRIRAPGGAGLKTPGAGAQAVVRTVARSGVRIGRIDDVTPLPTDSMKRKGGRRGRRV